MVFQLFALAFILFVLWRAAAAYLSGTLDGRKFTLWLLFWVSIAVVTLLPQTTSVIAAWVGIGRGVDLVLYLSVGLLFYGLFAQTRKVDGLERQLTALVRELALRDPEKSDSK